jgi:tetratricopeptide (TPR) repeat protein
MIAHSQYAKKHILNLFLIIAIGIVVYSNTLHAPFYFDDVRQIVTNPLIKDLNYFINLPEGRGREIYSDFLVRIVAYFTFALNYAIHGLSVKGYHIVNIWIHIANALLVYSLTILSFKTPLLCCSKVRDRSHLIALFSALIFVSHPVQTQAVTYIVQRLASLATMFYLLSLVLYIKWRLKSEQKRNSAIVQKHESVKVIFSRFPDFRHSELLLYCCSLISAVLAMKSKEIAFTLPLGIVLYEFMFFRGNVRKRLIFLTPVLLALLIIPFCHLASEKSVEGVQDIAASISGRGEVSRTDYLMTQFRVIVTYLRLLILPINQNLDYAYPVYHTFFTPPVYLSFLLLSAIFAIGVYLVFRSRASEPVLRLAAFGIFWFFLALSVESSIIPLTIIFEHRLYLPSAGLFIAAAVLMFSLPAKYAGRIIVLLSLVVLVLAVAGYSRNQLWNDPLAFWADVVRKSPGKARPHKGLAEAYVALGRYNEATQEYKAALHLDPYDADNQTNLMLIHALQGNYDEVFTMYEKLVRSGMDNARARNYVSQAYFKTGRIAEAERELRTSIQMDPDYDDARFNLGGRLLMEQGRYDEAEQELRAVLKINPEHDKAHNSLGVIYASLGRYSEAEKEFLNSFKLNPESIEPRNNLAGIYAQTGRVDEAVKAYQEALKIAPDNVEVRLNLGILYVQQELYDKAIKELEIVLRLKPDLEEARNYLRAVSDIKNKH